MSTYRIVCTDQPNCHIVSVGVGSASSKATNKFTVAEVWNMLDAGHTFYTSDDKGNVALVQKLNCACGRGSLRSSADAVVENNLDYMRVCRWTAA